MWGKEKKIIKEEKREQKQERKGKKITDKSKKDGKNPFLFPCLIQAFIAAKKVGKNQGHFFEHFNAGKDFYMWP